MNRRHAIGTFLGGLYAAVGVRFSNPQNEDPCSAKPTIIKSGWKEGEVEKLERELQESAKYVWEDYMRTRYDNFS